jgi:hypothetical protein
MEFVPKTLVTALVAACVVTGCGSDDDDTTSPEAPSTTADASPERTTTISDTTATTAPPEPDVRTIERIVSGGTVEGGVRNESVPLGEELRLEVTADVSDEVHLHGYDRFADVAPGTPGVIELTADIPGVFEVELEGSATLLFELEVAG